MEREGPHTGDGRNEADRAGNVVPFPRDWFGPPDELVPIGRSAPPPQRSPPGPPERDPTDTNDWTGWADDGVLVPLTPGNRDPQPPPARTRTAADFWGEESATVHDALQAPPPPPLRPTGPRRRARVGGLGRSAHRALGVPAAVALALTLIAASVFLTTRPNHPDGSRSPHTRQDTSGAVRSAARREGTILAASVLEAARHASRRAPSHVPVRAHPMSTPRRRTAPAATAPSPASVQPPPVSPPATPASTQSVSASSGSAAPSSATEAGASEATPSQSGPTGPAAAFGPGY